MSKVMYQVMVEGVMKNASTLKEVSALLGQKVTKAKINAGEYTGVITEVVNNEDMDSLEDNGTARIYSGNGEYHEIDLINPLTASKEDNNEEGATDMSAKDIDEDAIIRDIVDGGDYTEDTEESGTDEASNEEDTTSEANTDEASNEEDTEESDTDEDTNEEDTTESASTGTGSKDSLQSLMAKMKALNAKHEAEGTTNPGKNKRTKAIEFTGEYPEVGFFTEKKQLQKFYKQLTDDQLNDWIELEGLTYKPSDNEPINRMRKCMAILNLHFPKQSTGSSKKKSKYSAFTTEQLLEMALDNDIEVKEAKGDERILRMYAIMALRKAGVIE